jgi:mitotic spindle assembly checkpoint protein MAD2
MSSATDTKTIITLKGSVKIVSEFFFTAINSILYQRGIYQPETFKRDEKYGLTVLTTTDEGLLTYLDQVMGQMEDWLLAGDVQKLVVVVAGIDSGETLERWQFNVNVQDEGETNKLGGNDENNPQNVAAEKSSSAKPQKSLKEIHAEIQAIVRQITASVSVMYACCDENVYESIAAHVKLMRINRCACQTHAIFFARR